MGLSTRDTKRRSIGGKRILELLADAESKFRDNFQHAFTLGHVIQAREAATSLVLIKAFQVSLGIYTANDASAVPRLLGVLVSEQSECMFMEYRCNCRINLAS